MAGERGLNEFVASRGWLGNFIKRFNLSIRRRTTTGQSVPCDLKEKICNFVDFNKKQINVHNFHPSIIADMDETPIWADMPSTFTIEQRGTSTVPIRTTGHVKNAPLSACVLKQTEQN